MAGSDTRRDEDLLADAKEAFEKAKNHEADNRNEARDDIEFARLSKQWPVQIEQQRLRDGRPCLTINRLPSFIRQVVNNARQNKPGIVVHPVDSQADPETADILNGLIRQIEQSSDAEVAYDTALDFAVTGGFGYFKINTRYATDDTFDQDLVIERVANPFSIYGDPNSTAADSSDWMRAFELERLDRKAFKARWKNADPVSFGDDPTTFKDDRRSETQKVDVAAYWSREDSRKQIVALTMPAPDADPMQVMIAEKLGLSERLIIDLDTYEKNLALFQAIGMSVMGSPRDVPCWTVTQHILSGAEVLETIEWAGKYIPIVPVYGEEVNFEGVRHFRSMVRDAKDEQRRYNYQISAATELSGLAPKNPYIGRKGAFETDAEKWATINTQNWPYLEYDGQDPPQRQSLQGVPIAEMQLAAQASDNLKAIMGVFDASLGAQGNETTGRAILARQGQSDVSNFHFMDNLSRAIRHGGRIILDMIPKVYSTERVIRIVNARGEQASVKIAPSQPPEATDEAPQGQMPVGADPPAPPQPTAPMAGQPPMGAPVGGPMQPQQPMIDPQTGQQLAAIERIYDLTVGKYDLTVSAGPTWASEREEMNTAMVELVRAFPAAAPALAPLIIKTFDIPDADEVAQALEGAAQGQNNPQAAKQAQQMQQSAQHLAEAQQQIAELNQKLQMAQFENQMVKREADLKVREAALQQNDLGLRSYEAQTDRLQAVTDANRVSLEAQPGPLHSPAA